MKSVSPADWKFQGELENFSFSCSFLILSLLFFCSFLEFSPLIWKTLQDLFGDGPWIWYWTNIINEGPKQTGLVKVMQVQRMAQLWRSWMAQVKKVEKYQLWFELILHASRLGRSRPLATCHIKPANLRSIVEKIFTSDQFSRRVHHNYFRCICRQQ